MCRLCRTLTDHRQINIFNKPGVDRDLANEILIVCGVSIRPDDVLPKAICRSCDRFVGKVVKKRFEYAENQKKWKDTPQTNVRQIALKRVHLTPPSAEKSPSSTSVTAKQPRPTKDCRSRKQLFYTDIPTLKKLSVLQKGVDAVTAKFLTDEEADILHRAVDCRVPSAIANALYKNQYPVVLALKKLILNDMASTAGSFSHTTVKKSVLNDHTFEAMRDFQPLKVWDEMLSNFPFLVDILAACSKHQVGRWTEMHMISHYGEKWESPHK